MDINSLTSSLPQNNYPRLTQSQEAARIIIYQPTTDEKIMFKRTIRSSYETYISPSANIEVKKEILQVMNEVKESTKNHYLNKYSPFAFKYLITLKYLAKIYILEGNLKDAVPLVAEIVTAKPKSIKANEIQAHYLFKKVETVPEDKKHIYLKEGFKFLSNVKLINEYRAKKIQEKQINQNLQNHNTTDDKIMFKRTIRSNYETYLSPSANVKDKKEILQVMNEVKESTKNLYLNKYSPFAFKYLITLKYLAKIYILEGNLKDAVPLVAEIVTAKPESIKANEIQAHYLFKKVETVPEDKKHIYLKEGLKFLSNVKLIREDRAKKIQEKQINQNLQNYNIDKLFN
jgi:hypothetical protein